MEGLQTYVEHCQKEQAPGRVPDSQVHTQVESPRPWDLVGEPSRALGLGASEEKHSFLL